MSHPLIERNLLWPLSCIPWRECYPEDNVEKIIILLTFHFSAVLLFSWFLFFILTSMENGFYKDCLLVWTAMQMSVSPQFFTLVLSSARLSLPTLDSFEPFRGAVSGSSSFYTFTEFLQSREFWQQAVQQCALSMHLTAYCCLVTNCFLVWKMQWFLPVLNPFSISCAEPSASSEGESFQTCSSYWHLTSQ